MKRFTQVLTSYLYSAAVETQEVCRRWPTIFKIEEFKLNNLGKKFQTAYQVL
jgi:hypothetical protein